MRWPLTLKLASFQAIHEQTLIHRGTVVFVLSKWAMANKAGPFHGMSGLVFFMKQ
jgi:hypothetical protein